MRYPLPTMVPGIAAALALWSAGPTPRGEGEGAGGGPGREIEGFELERWLAGRALFGHTATEAEGLGPGFNAASCGACHLDPVPGGAGKLEFNVPASAGGYLRLQGAARPGLADERPRLLDASKSSGARRADLVAGTLQTPSLLGLGLLERVPEDEILSREDLRDRDGDGVRGVARQVMVDGSLLVGRFGWNADIPTLDAFVRVACGGELGLTVPAAAGFGMDRDFDQVPDPEMSGYELDALVFFCRELAPPARGGRAEDPRVRRGEQAFQSIGCAVCHVPALQGADGPVHAYTDLLLHAVVMDRQRLDGCCGFGSGFGKPDLVPVPFRTPPLWGVGATAPYLHDGRAATLEEAIEAHLAEGESARRRFEALPEERRADLLLFLADL